VVFKVQGAGNSLANGFYKQFGTSNFTQHGTFAVRPFYSRIDVNGNRVTVSGVNIDFYFYFYCCGCTPFRVQQGCCCRGVHWCIDVNGGTRGDALAIAYFKSIDSLTPPAGDYATGLGGGQAPAATLTYV
jgi:hypothetical protein